MGFLPVVHGGLDCGGIKLEGCRLKGLLPDWEVSTDLPVVVWIRWDCERLRDSGRGWREGQEGLEAT